MWEGSVGLVLVFSEPLGNDGGDKNTSYSLKIGHQFSFHERVLWDQFLGTGFVRTKRMCWYLSLAYLGPGFQQWWRHAYDEGKQKRSARCPIGGSRDPAGKFTITKTWSWLRAFALAVSSTGKLSSQIYLNSFSALNVPSPKVEQLTMTGI